MLDTDTHHPDQSVLQYVQMFDSWKEMVRKVDRPISKQQQCDWLLDKLLKDDTPRIDDIDEKELRQNAPDWKNIMSYLQSGDDPYLKTDRSLADKKKIQEIYYGEPNFPFRDPKEPECYIETIASGSTVRGDNPFTEIRIPVRKTIAIDMEGAAFYRAVADYPGLKSLLVKGVSDYADGDKDDSYHEYASTASAMYMLCFIRELVLATNSA